MILDTARRLFAEQGYEKTSFRDIADKAQVSESSIFRAFRTKSQLFEEAILDPFDGFVTEFISKWRVEPTSFTNKEVITRFVTELYDLMNANRDLVRSLFSSTYSFSPAGSRGHDSFLSRELDVFAEFVQPQAAHRRVDGSDLWVTIRLVFGQVMSAVLFDAFLFPRDARHPSRERVIAELAALVRQGVERGR